VIWQTDQFLELSGECVKLVLSREDLSCCRVDLARAVLRWLSYDRCGRTAWMRCLMEFLRLSAEEYEAVATSQEFVCADCDAQRALRERVVVGVQ